MTDSDRSRALDILAGISGVERERLEPGMSLAADLGIDSPKALQLLVDLEDELDLEISDEDAAGMNTVGDVLRFLDDR
jgi:acyl carrier protein